MRTTSKSVTFTRPFALAGLGSVQPAGTYIVEMDEERLPVLLHTAYRRVATWIVLPAGPSGGPSQFVSIDAEELDSALSRDAPAWSAAAEARVDDMLTGKVMEHAVRSAGLTLGEFKGQLRDLAGRLERTRVAPIEDAPAVSTRDIQGHER